MEMQRMKRDGEGAAERASADDQSWTSGRETAAPFADEVVQPREASGGLDLRSIIGLIRRQIKLIIATILVVNGIAALIIFQLTPIYTATALVMVDPRQKDILDPEGQVSLLPNDSGRVESEVGILRSPAVMVGVVRDLDLTNDPSFVPRPGWQSRLKEMIGAKETPPTAEAVANTVLANLRNTVAIARQGLTYLIEISAKSTDPQKAATIANSVADNYIKAQIDAKIETADIAQQKILSRLDAAVASVRAAEDKIDRFVDDNLSAIHDTATLDDIASFQRDIDSQQARRLDLAKNAGQLDQLRRSGDWDQLIASVQSDQLKALNASRESIESQLNADSSDEAKAVRLREQLSELDKRLNLEALTAVSQLRADVDAAQQQENDLKQKRRDKIISSLPKDVVVRLYEVQKEADSSRSVYERMLNSSKAVEAQKELQVADSRVVSKALPPSSPSFPNTRMLFLLCGIASIGLGLGLAFLRENYVGGFVDEAQTESVLGVPALSSLPSLEQNAGWKADGAIPANEIILHPISPYSEAVRRVRLGVDLGRRRRAVGAQTILISSAVPNEGKTQTAVSLARAFALSGKKTLLIDCDLRRPTVHKSLGIEARPGFIDYLSGAAGEDALNDLVSVDPATGLSMIVGATGSRSATDSLLDSARLERLLELAQGWFDFIVIDSSPLLPVIDARLLLRYATATVLVVRWAQTSQQEVRAALSDLGRVNYRNVPVFVVLNQVEVGSFGYGYRGRYKSYYAEATG